MDQLSAIDTPTLSNAIEKLHVRNRISGFCDRTMRCLFPELGVMCGQAVTVEVETISPESDGALDKTFVDLCAILAKSDGPSVMVLRECSAHPEFSAHCGEILATAFQRLGAVGLVSDSAVRDIEEVRSLGFHLFAPGAVASHGSFRFIRLQVPMTVCGLPIQPGDLLHGDVNGLIKVPEQGVEKLPGLVEEVRRTERKALDYIKSDEFEARGLCDRLTH